MTFVLLIQMVLKLVFILISVAFFSLFERKLLGLIQARKGPAKVGMLGLLQPFADAMKLLLKEEFKPFSSLELIYVISPSFFFLVSVVIWVGLPDSWVSFNFPSNILFFLACLSVSVYGLIFMGWFSNSKFSLIGSVRAVSQTVSYEIVLSFILLSLMVVTASFCTNSILELQELVWGIFPMCWLSLILFFSFLAEGNRSPFDLTEGESELVGGYSVEYGGLSYTLVFLGENLSLIWMSVVFSLLLLGPSLVFAKSLVLISLFVLVRASEPRLRYDSLMGVCWVKLVPFSLLIMAFYLLSE